MAPVVPAVPRIFEVRTKVAKPSDSAALPNGLQALPESPRVLEAEKAHAVPEEKQTSPPDDPVDCVSLAGEDEPTHESSIGDQPDMQETPRNGLAEEDTSDTNGLTVQTTSRSPSPEPEAIVTPTKAGQAARQHNHNTNGHKQTPSIPQANGHPPVMPGRPQAPAYPPGFGPMHRRAVHNIAFGSFGDIAGSDRSSPTLPPSATSTHFTHPTPLSDTHSQTSRVGPVNGAVEQAAEHAAPRPLGHHGHAQQSKSFDQRHNGLQILRHASVKFSEQNKDQLLKVVERDFFASGRIALNLLVETKDGRDSFTVSRAICRRSPILSRLLDQPANDSANSTHALAGEIQAFSSFATMESVRAILQSLYGTPLLPAEILDGHEALHFKRPLDMIATGYLLGAGLVIDYGTELALKLIGWESLSANFQFCLEQTHFEYGDGKAPELVNLPSLVQYARPEYVSILAQSLDCIIREINGDEGFRFSAHAAYFPELGGSFHAPPASVELTGYTPNANPTHGPSRIQFGSMGNLLRHKHQTLSSILLSLPLSVLQHVLAHVFNLNTVKEVIDERDKRRVFAVNGGLVPYHAHYQESIVPTPEFNGMRVISRKVF